MASKINPKGVFKSNAKPKGPNPRGINKVSPAAKINPKGINPVKPSINSGGINPGGIKKPIVKASTPSSTNSTTISSSSNRNSRPVKTGGKPVRVGAKPVRVGSTSPTNTSSAPSAPSTPKTNTSAKTEPLSSKPANRTSRPVRSGSKPVREGSKPVRTGSKQIKTGKGTSFKVGAKPVSGSTSVTPKSSFASKASKVGKVGKVAGKVVGKVAGAATLVQLGSMVHNDINERSKAMFKRVKDKEAKAKKDKVNKDTTNTSKPQVGGNRSAKTLIETPSLKDELKKRVGDRSKVAGKDKWGRSPSDKWYGFNPKSKKYEAPTMVKADTKKAETKPVVKTPPVKKPTTTPKATTPKVSTTVDKMETKPTAPIANITEAKKEIIQPKAAATATASTSPSTSSSTPSSSTPTSGAQPKATFGNKVRGMLNESRERRAGRAASRGNEDRSEKLKEKISETEKKMMMRKGGTVKRNKKK